MRGDYLSAARKMANVTLTREERPARWERSVWGGSFKRVERGVIRWVEAC